LINNGRTCFPTNHQGGNVGEVFGRLKEAVEIIESQFAFSRDDRLGFLTFCPTNLGTTIRYGKTKFNDKINIC
jgi:protein-arginine kinase